MTPEKEMNEELRQLLDSLEEHGKNVRRQKQLGDLIDRLAGEEKPVVMPRKRAKLVPIWWAMGTAAAILLLLLFVKLNVDENTNLNKDIVSEKTETVDTVKVETEDVVVEEPVIKKEESLAENTPVVTPKKPIKKKNDRVEMVETVVEQSIVAEVIPMETSDTLSNTIENTNPIIEEPSAVQKPQRRVIRSLNLVCYECQRENDNFQFQAVNAKSEKTLFGQPQDPNMKDGALAWQVKLN